MFERLRHFDSNSSEEYSYPEKCGRHKIDKIRDLTVGILVDYKNGGTRSKPRFPSSKSSEMITFYFENGCTMTIRTSGTEPKIKWYSEIKQLDKTKYCFDFIIVKLFFKLFILIKNFKRTREEIRADLEDLVKSMINEFYQPEKNNFTARST